MRTLRRLLLAVLAVMILSSMAVAQHYTFTSIANLSDYNGYFEPATINNFGEVLFAPAMKSGGEGVLLIHHGTLTTIAQGGQPAPGGGIFDTTYSPIQMNDLGEVAFTMARDYGSEPALLGYDAGVYRWNSHTGVVPVMLRGMATPDGGHFWGSWFGISVTNAGNVYFPGMVCTTVISWSNPQPCPNATSGMFSFGLYKADRRGRITTILKPGDAAPNGSFFDFAQVLEANHRGDVAFQAHVNSDPCPSPWSSLCYEGLFLKSGESGKVVGIAAFGTPSPVPGKNYGGTNGTNNFMVNAAGEVAFGVSTSPTGDWSEQSVFLYSHGKTIVVALPGDPMPGGGKAVEMSILGQSVVMNNWSEIVFSAALDDGGQGIYLWRPDCEGRDHGKLSLVARTGTQTPAGVIADFNDGWSWIMPTSQLWINDWGQVLFAAHFQDGSGAMMVATPR